MQVLRSIDALSTLPGPLALAVGVFDGLHLGHQEVIRAAQEHAAQHHGTAVVATFDPHPAQVLRPGVAPKRICGPRHQQLSLSQIGISHLLACPFTATTALTPARDFVSQLIQAARPLGCISVGYTWKFGHGREGDIHLLMEMGQNHGFAVYGVPAVKVGGEVVSSTLIRDALSRGDLKKASTFLGRPWALYGTVVAGRRLGRELGFPTANVAFENEQLPPLGVYAVDVMIEGVKRRAVANLGRKPTVEPSAPPSLEVHVPHWTGDLYGQDLEVCFTRFLRPEMKFNGLDELKAQIRQDTEEALNSAS